VKFNIPLRLTRTAAITSLCSLCLVGACDANADEPAATQEALAPLETSSVSLAQAMKLIETASATARAHHLALSFAIVDPGGHLIAAVRMDGAPFASLDFARGKAFASVALGGQSGATLEQRFKDDPSEYSKVITHPSCRRGACSRSSPVATCSAQWARAERLRKSTNRRSRAQSKRSARRLRVDLRRHTGNK
jgi:glc operon protein GlcG